MPVEPYALLYTVREVAKNLKINMSDVYKEINEGHLPYILLGSKKVRGIDLENYINRYPIESRDREKQ